MNKRIKSLVLSATLVASMAILGNCGSNNIDYVDTIKVANSTEKDIAISQEINAKKAELNKRIEAADDASKQNAILLPTARCGSTKRPTPPAVRRYTPARKPCWPMPSL